MPEVEITIAICSHNRTEGLRDCLKSLLRQETDGLFRFEIIVVHTGSPGTPEAIEELSREVNFDLRGILQMHGGAVTARNRCITESRGEWIALFDDDQIAEPQWIRELWLVAREKKVKSVGGKLYLQLPEGCDRNLSKRCRRMLGETVMWDSVQPYTRQEGPGSGNQMIHRDVFEKVGLYDQSFTLRGYDTDMYRRIREAGFESWFSPKAIGYHVIPVERLHDDFFKETSLHNGWSFARRDLLEKGVAFASCTALMRAGQALTLNMARLLWTQCTGDREQILEGRIRLWRAEGYVRSVLYKLFPRILPQSKFFRSYEFRAEKRFPTLKSDLDGGTA